MRKPWSYFIVAVTTMVLLGSIKQAQAGWVMEEKNGEKTLLSEGKLKSTWEEGGMILDGKSGKIILYNTEQKVFSKGTLDDLCNAYSTIYENMLKSIPPEQRKMIEQMMGSGAKGAPPKVNIEKAGKGETIVGFKTVKYKVHVDGDLYAEVWLTDQADLMKEFKPLAGMFGKFMSCFGGSMMKHDPEATPEYLKLMETGVILKSISYEDGSPTPDTSVMKLEKKKLSASEFQPPSGFREVEFLEAMGMDMGMDE